MTEQQHKPGLLSKLSLPEWSMHEAQRFMFLAILIGIFAGLLVVCFHIAIDFIKWFAIGTLAESSILATILSPAVGAMIASLLVLFVFKGARGSGVIQAKSAVYVYDGYVPFSSVIGKFLACSISIGSGNSLGPEDPALQMGEGVASLLGRAFRLSRDSMRMIAPVGAAAGLAAAFNAPITAILFVMEEVLVGWRTGVMGAIVLASTSAVVVSRWFLGNDPLFSVPKFQLSDPLELIVHALMGIATGLLAVFFMRSISLLKRLQKRLSRRARYLLPGIAGMLVGIAGLWVPQVMGVGYDAIDSALHNRFPWTLLLAIGLVKIVVTLLGFSTGTPGGMFAPTLVAGAMIGGALGSLAHYQPWFPTSASDAYVLVGMGTFFAGVFRAPLTAIFMVFEVSANYVIILPVMIANTIAFGISRRYHPVPFFEMHAKDEGLVLPSVEAEHERPHLRVEDAMEKPHAVFGPRTLVKTAVGMMQEVGDTFRLVKTGEGKWSWVCRSHLEEAVTAGHGDLHLEKAVRCGPAPRLFPDTTLDQAMKVIGDHAILPVVSRANTNQLVGTLTLRNIHQAFGIDPDKKPCE